MMRFISDDARKEAGLLYFNINVIFRELKDSGMPTMSESDLKRLCRLCFKFGAVCAMNARFEDIKRFVDG